VTGAVPLCHRLAQLSVQRIDGSGRDDGRGPLYRPAGTAP
jgi:hypothetical protein